MRVRYQTVLSKLANPLEWLRGFWHESKTFRYVTLSLAANLVGYSLVYVLTLKGVGKWWANESVSKGMAPAGLALNSLALTGRIKPTFGQVTKWTIYWFPSALVGAVCMGFVIAKFGLGSLESRAVAGLMMFPFDYTIKRFVIFAKQAWASRLLRKAFALVRQLQIPKWMKIKTA
jgi:hypothetical protein